MPKKISILLLSLIVAFGFMSGGYGYWQKTLVIDGSGIRVIPVERDLDTLNKTYTSNDAGQVPTQTKEENVNFEKELGGDNSENTGNSIENSNQGNSENIGDRGNNSAQRTDSDSSNEPSSNESGSSETSTNESTRSESGDGVSTSSDSGSNESSSSNSSSSDSGSSDSGSSDSSGE